MKIIPVFCVCVCVRCGARFINVHVSLNVCLNHTAHTNVPETLHEESLSDGDEGICHRSAVFFL